jgi:predicted regulator of Ras-like GTPase activity (Roadblock/LC7/MglB family)
MVKKKKGFQEIEADMGSVTVEEEPVKNLRANLEEIKNYDGVIGYILRNSTSATIDLKDPTKIIDYAVLSSSALDAGEKLCELFSLGKIINITVEGREVKVLSSIIHGNRVSIFMEKNVNCKEIFKKLNSL